jgi:hypothetical protein
MKGMFKILTLFFILTGVCSSQPWFGPRGAETGFKILFCGSATIGNDDSVQVAVPGILPTDCILASYGPNAFFNQPSNKPHLSWNIVLPDTLSVYGLAEKNVRFILTR